MVFLQQGGTAALLVIFTLCVQCAGMGVLIHWARSRAARGIYQLGLLDSALLMIRFTSVMFAMHALQIVLWAAFYRGWCLSNWESSLYFSATSYATIGATDVGVPRTWRLMAPLESVIGMLMCGLSVSFLFAIVTRLVGREAGPR
jgi:voltage-gated potassium channel